MRHLPEHESRRRQVSGSERGFTLVEVTIAVAVAVPLIMAIFGTTKLVNDTITASATSAECHAVLRETAQRIGRLVRPGKLSTFEILSDQSDVTATPSRAASAGEWIDPVEQEWRDGVRFEAAAGLLSMNAALSTLPREFRFVLDNGEVANGVDDDGDGFVDEGSIRLLYDNNQVVLVNTFENFEISLDGRFMEVRMTAVRSDDRGRVYRASLEQSFYVRNN